MNAQILERNGQPAFAVIPIEDYERIAELLEDITDAEIASRISAKLKSGEEESFPASIVEHLLNGENPVRILREYRGMSVLELANACGVTRAHIYQIESGKREMSVELLRKLVFVLNVDADMLL